MDVLSNLLFKNSSMVLHANATFPENPTPGEIALVDGVVYVYTTLDNFRTWYPMTNRKQNYIHTQGLESTEWIIEHNMNTTNYIFMAYDSNGALMDPSYEPIDNNSFKVIFTLAKAGKLIVFAETEEFVKGNELNYNESSVDQDTTVPAGQNASIVEPTIEDGSTLTVEDDAVLVIL